MQLAKNLGDRAINDVLKEHPAIGEILQRYDIGCVTCGVGICLLKDVVSIHALGADLEQQLENEINRYLTAG